MGFLLDGVRALTAGQAVMVVVGACLIWLAIRKRYEPALLLPMGFGAILVNLPFSGVINQTMGGIGESAGLIQWLFETAIESAEVLPTLLFIGIGAMIDFGPLLSQPVMFLFGAAAQFGIFFAISLAALLGFDLRDAASIGIIGAADGPTSILVAQIMRSRYMGAITVAAYSYMALVPIIQPLVIRLLTTREERRIPMRYRPGSVTQRTKILFPILASLIVGLVAPASVSLVGFLMFGNLIRECGVLDNLVKIAQEDLSKLITLLLGLTISFSMRAEFFVRTDTLLILLIGLAAFIFDTVGGVLFAKGLNFFLREKINPMIGAAGISAFPMASRVVQKIAAEEDRGNLLLMHAAGANVAGQIASVVAGGLVISLVTRYLGGIS